MKKFSAIALLLAAALTVSACSDTQNENNNGTPSGTATENAAQENTGNNSEDNSGDNSENNEDNNVETSGENSDEQPNPPTEDIQAAIEQFDYDSFTGPDGEEVMLTEASQTNGYFLSYDFGYIRYADAIYSDTVANPDLFDFENYGFTVDNEAAANPYAFKVVKGQTLDNGLTVSEATYSVFPDGRLSNTVNLDGEITLEGLLFCYF